MFITGLRNITDSSSSPETILCSSRRFKGIPRRTFLKCWVATFFETFLCNHLCVPQQHKKRGEKEMCKSRQNNEQMTELHQGAVSFCKHQFLTKKKKNTLVWNQTSRIQSIYLSSSSCTCSSSLEQSVFRHRQIQVIASVLKKDLFLTWSSLKKSCEHSFVFRCSGNTRLSLVRVWNGKEHEITGFVDVDDLFCARQ